MLLLGEKIEQALKKVRNKQKIASDKSMILIDFY